MTKKQSFIPNQKQNAHFLLYTIAFYTQTPYLEQCHLSKIKKYRAALVVIFLKDK